MRCLVLLYSGVNSSATTFNSLALQMTLELSKNKKLAGGAVYTAYGPAAVASQAFRYYNLGKSH